MSVNPLGNCVCVHVLGGAEIMEARMGDKLGEKAGWQPTMKVSIVRNFQKFLVSG